MTNASSRTPISITTLRPTSRRRWADVLPYSSWILRYRNILPNPVWNPASLWKLQRCYIWRMCLAYKCLKSTDVPSPTENL
jgi:hypothetical protein